MERAQLGGPNFADKILVVLAVLGIAVGIIEIAVGAKNGVFNFLLGALCLGVWGARRAVFARRT